MAACYGLNIVRAMAPIDRAPAWAVLGPSTQVLPSDLIRGFSAFYGALLCVGDFSDALDALQANAHSWPDTWCFHNASSYSRTFRNRGIPRTARCSRS